MANHLVTPELLGEYEQRLLDLSLNLRQLQQQMAAEQVPSIATSVRTFEGAIERLERYFPNFTHAFSVDKSVRTARLKMEARAKKKGH